MANSLDTFGEILIKKVRDTSILHWDKIASGKIIDEENSSIGTLGKQELELIQRLIPKIVDTTIHNLLSTIEREENIYIVIDSNGNTENLSEESDGLAGELYGKRGWIKKFSSQRDYN